MSADEMTARAEVAEALLLRVLDKAEGWSQMFDNALTPEGETLRDAGREIIKLIEGAR